MHVKKLQRMRSGKLLWRADVNIQFLETSRMSSHAIRAFYGHTMERQSRVFCNYDVAVQK